MTRDFSRESEPHRVLKLDLREPMRGSDVKSLQVAALRRLDARGIERHLDIDGELGPKTMEVLQTASHFMGALKKSYDPEINIGAQRIIRYPGYRNDQQLARAKVRMKDLIKQRQSAAKKARSHPHGRAEVALAAFRLAYNHRGRIHYTQGRSRWEGINRGLRASEGEFPRYADCSSMFTWCWWQTLHNGPDVLNGQHWQAGYTGTLLSHGERISEPEPGCAIIYGHGFPGTHVAMYDKNGMCYSHGSEAGPFYINYRYRSDVMQFRRYV